jgi:hypothetical protein
MNKPWFKPGDLVRINDDDLEDCHGKLALIQSSAYNLDPACPTVRVQRSDIMIYYLMVNCVAIILSVRW